MPIITTIRGNVSPFGKRFNRIGSSTGGTITTSGGYRIHTFTTIGSSTFTAADTGTVVCLANAWAVTDFTSQGSTTAYNVPGSTEYNADESVDFIIASTEDPTS